MGIETSNGGSVLRCLPWSRCIVGLALLLISSGALFPSAPFMAQETKRSPTTEREVVFRQVTATAGVTFRHRHFGTGEKFMPENMGAGVAVFDANGDDLLDLYFVQGAPFADADEIPLAQRSNQLFLQKADGGFVLSTDSGLEDTGYGMGVAIGDIDGDGRSDVLVTNYGRNELFRGLGDGRFVRETEERGLTGEENSASAWSTSAAFFDADRDGDLDLYIANYLDASLEDNKYCGNAARSLRSYCHPDIYEARPDVFYRNLGDGHFRDETLAAGFRSAAFASQSKGLGVFVGDLDGSGGSDVYVADDSTRNLLFLNTDLRFEESSLLAGVGYNGAGQPEASMGIAGGDVDGDGRLDLFVTHLDEETNTLYLNLGDGLFNDSTAEAGLSAPSLPWVGFGTQLFDVDLDGDLDLFVLNGHIIDNISAFDATRSHRQPAQLFRNDGRGHFTDISSSLGLDESLVGRGAVAADWDRDGDLDLVLTQNDGPAILLENQTEHGPSIAVRLVAGDSAKEGIGATLTFLPDGHESRVAEGSTLSVGQAAASAPGRPIVRFVDSTSSYLSQPPREVIVPVDNSAVSVLEIRWPSGHVQRLEIAPSQGSHRVLTVKEPDWAQAAPSAPSVP